MEKLSSDIKDYKNILLSKELWWKETAFYDAIFFKYTTSREIGQKMH